MTFAKDLSERKLNLVVAQEVGWDTKLAMIMELE